ncbi:phosphotransferase [Nonomuraea phyllanthi]|uniref:phosphotransferase n=1 Tax=Nonomuraea phyllanthi TaxID=2219224 RepID=UPI001D00573B|nr:phosphotransferase [Nonomuraea phyllanthi]
MEEIEVVVAHSERATPRLGEPSIASQLDSECAWLVTNDVLPTDLVTRNRQVAETALRPWTPVFTHGDLQISHVFEDGDEVTGVLDWSEAAQGVMVAAEPAGGPLAGRARLRPGRARLRDRRAEVPDVRPHEP